MLTISLLKKNTPIEIRQRGRSCAIQRLKRNFFSKEQYVEHKFRSKCNVEPHLQLVRIYTKDRVWLTCDCKFWLYYCEVAVASAGSSSVLHSNGEDPGITNPSRIPFLCKHLWAVTNSLHVKEEKDLIKDLQNNVLRLLSHDLDHGKSQKELDKFVGVNNRVDLKTILKDALRKGWIQKGDSEGQHKEQFFLTAEGAEHLLSLRLT
jgi:hypothetical protein